MKKMYLLMTLLICVVLSMGVANAADRHFDYDEAWQIADGRWIDTDTNKEYVFVWKSINGSECNIVNSKGWTNPKGNSRILFDYKGLKAFIEVTYYPDQDRYYGRVYTFDDKSYSILYNCVMKK